ncbi:MAG: flagellar biosynthesis protein FlhF [Polyangiaceae bacterium]|nr:flagellar biosynthesis protein FlhF [Polyangiaceae bacterium]
MQHQVFRGNDVRDAMSAVRAALGPDAIIESTRHVTNGRSGALGHAFVEITATGIQKRTPWAFGTEPAGAERRSARGWQRSGLALRSLDPTPDDGSHAPDLSEIEQELRLLRAMFEQLNATRPPRERALALLQSVGIGESLAREIARGAGRVVRRDPDALRDWLASRIRSRLAIFSGLLRADEPLVVACVGPTGAGKTTTLAKLAARARLDFDKRVSVISLDTYRVGAVEQWRRYAALMGVGLGIATKPAEFARLVAAQNSDIVLVDTSGRLVDDTDETWPVVPCLATVQDRRVHVLVALPTWLHAADAERVMQQYRFNQTTSAVFTKIDETPRTGGVLSAAISADVSVAYLCNGPRVPEDIVEANAELLLGALFTGAS